jgi:hypothetical protein
MVMEIKSSGSEQKFSTGAVRDTAEGKPKWSLVSPYFIQKVGFKPQIQEGIISTINCVCLYQQSKNIERLAEAFYSLDGKYEDMIHWLELGAKRYSRYNWAKGISITRCLDSLHRHLQAIRNGLDDEDHKAAAKCNIMFIVHYSTVIRLGYLPRELDDMPDFFNIENMEKGKE